MFVLKDEVGPNKMAFTLKDGGTSFQFPVNPEEVSISRSKGYETINMLEHGEFDFAQGEKVKEITFSSFFPKEYDAFYCMYKENLPDPRVAMNVLNTFLISKKPLRFIISETGVNVPVFIVSLNSSFRGGDRRYLLRPDPTHMAGFQGGEGGLCGIREQVRFSYRFEKEQQDLHRQIWRLPLQNSKA